MTQRLGDMNRHESDITEFNGMARALERSEVRRASTSLLQARKNVARRLGIAADSIENFRKLRSKIVPHWLMTRVRFELLSALESEAQNLEHEIHYHRQTGQDPDPDALAAAEAQLAATRKLLTNNG